MVPVGLDCYHPPKETCVACFRAGRVARYVPPVRHAGPLDLPLDMPCIPEAPVIVRRPCKYLGAVQPGQESQPCGGKLRGCMLHNECTTGYPVEGMPCCRDCNDHSHPQPIPVPLNGPVPVEPGA